MSRPINPYKVLRIKPDATAEQVTAAYRAASLKAHPDRGGTPERFARVKLAYDILRDPERRKLYDADGVYAEVGPDNALSAVLPLLQEVFVAVAQHFISERKNPAIDDLIPHMLQVLENRENDMRKERKKTAQAIPFLRECLGRFETDAEVNMMEDIIKQELYSMEAADKNIAEQMILNDKARVLVKTFKYRYTRQIGNKWSSMFMGGREFTFYRFGG